MHQGAEGADHEPGADEQHQRQRDLHDDQGLARAMPLAALAQGASSFAETAVHARAGILDDRDGANEKAGEERERKSEEQHRKVDPRVVQPA